MTQTSTSDRKSIRNAEKLAAQIAAEDHLIVTALMSSMQGRRFLWSHLSSCHIFTQSMTDSDRWTAFNEGRRSAGSELLDVILAACPELYILAMREANDRANTDRARGRNATGADSADDLSFDPDPAAGIDYDPDANRVDAIN